MVSVDRQTPINKLNDMAFKFVVLCATLAFANAGVLPAVAPVAYSAAADVSHSYISAPVAPLAIHAPAVGVSQQNVIRSLGGNAAISTYSKAVDSAFSSVRKYDTRITNTGLPLAVAHAAPVATYAAPVATYAHAAPVATYAAAPVATYAHAAPVATYAAAPVVAKAAIAYSPSVAVSHMTFSGLGVNYGW